MTSTAPSLTKAGVPFAFPGVLVLIAGDAAIPSRGRRMEFCWWQF
jgi:hypothetical protein